MVHQSCSYLKLKGSTYYFSRRVPKPLQKHFKTDRVEVCLHTPQQSSAVRRLRRWQVNLKTIGISSEDERLSTGSLGSSVTAVMT